MISARKIVNFSRSIKLTIFLIAYIIATSLIASVIPQGLDREYYRTHFNPFFARLILFFRFNDFYYSLTFFFPASIFFLNITSCTIYRIYHGWKNKRKKYGPDLIHIGLILLLLGGMYSLFDREESVVFLNVGDRQNLRNGYQIILKDFDMETYDSGIVKDWISDVELRRNGSFIRNDTIEVNKPSAFGQYKVYQFSYRKTLNVTVRDENGKQYRLEQGSVLNAEDKNYMLSDIVTRNDSDEMLAVFNEYDGIKRTNNQMRLATHETIGRYELVSVQADLVSGLNIVKDNSYVILFPAIFLMILGLIVTYYKDVFKGERE
jgi:cytochrome c biogenesis protein ResB